MTSASTDGLKVQVLQGLLGLTSKVLKVLPDRASDALLRRARKSRYYAKVHAWRSARLSDAVMATIGAPKGADYREYIEGQVHRSYGVQRTAQPKAPIERTQQLVPILNASLEGKPTREVLCVGCRNANEIDHIESTCGARVVGLDLFSVDPRIQVGDMHHMPFEDGRFDGVYACHSLEHSYDLDQVLREINRVLRPGGVLVAEVPTKFVPSEHDRVDVGSADGFVKRLGSMHRRTMFSKDLSLGGGDRPVKHAARVAVELAGQGKSA